MAKSYSYTVYLKDKMSGAMQRIATNTGAAFSKINTNYGNFQKSNAKVGSSINQLNAKLDTFKRQRNNAFSVKDIRKFNGQILKTERQLKKLENLPPLSFRQRLQGIGSKMGGLIGVAGGVTVALSAWRGITGVVQLGADMEQTRVSFSTMLGSAEQANTMVKNLNNFANTTPFSNKEVLTAGKNLIAFGVDANSVEGTLSKLGDVASGVGVPFNELSSIYGKMKVGKVIQMEDINQLAGRGIPVFEYLAQSLGVNEDQIRKLSSQGKISFSDLDTAFNLMTQSGGKFNGMMDAQAKTFSGRWSTLKGKLQSVAIAIGEKLLPYASKFVDIGLKMVAFLPQIPLYFDAIQQTVNDNAVSFGLLGIAVAALSAKTLFLKAQTLAFTIAAKAQTTWTLLTTKAQWLFNAAVSANPIGAAVAAIAALGAGVVWAYKKVGWFRGGILAAWEGIKGFGMAIKNLVVNRIQEMISGITGIGKTLMLFFKGEWKAAWNEGKKATQNLTGIGGKASGQFITDMKATGVKSALAYQKGVKEVADKKKTTTALAGTANEALGDPFSSRIKTPATSTSTLGDDTAVSNGLSGITSGGKSQTHINIEFGKLIEQLVIKTETFSEGVDDMEDRLKAMLMRVLNSMNQLQTQPQ